MEKTTGGIGWIEIGTGDAEGARRFYGDMFGWTFQGDPDGRADYSVVTVPGGAGPSGGILDHGGTGPDYAIFYVRVEDVPAALARAEALGGKTLTPPTDGGNGLVFGQLADPTGHHIGVYSPPAG
jgi:uncharacterized protein